MEKGAKFGIGFGIGILLGFGLALLLAPKSGKETRSIIVDKVKRFKEKLKKKGGRNG
jgi:gas vesicle protein